MFVFVVIGVGQTTHRIDEYRVWVQRRRNSKVVGSRCCCCCCANIETGLESFWNVDFVRRVWLVVHWGEPCFIAMTGRMLLVLHLIATAFKNPSSFSIFLYTQRRKCVCQKRTVLHTGRKPNIQSTLRQWHRKASILFSSCRSRDLRFRSTKNWGDVPAFPVLHTSTRNWWTLRVLGGWQIGYAHMHPNWILNEVHLRSKSIDMKKII